MLGIIQELPMSVWLEPIEPGWVWPEMGQAGWGEMGRESERQGPKEHIPPNTSSQHALGVSLPAKQKLSNLVKLHWSSAHPGVATWREETKGCCEWRVGTTQTPFSFSNNHRYRVSSSFLSVYPSGFTLSRELWSEGLQQCILDLVITWGEKKRSLLS